MIKNWMEKEKLSTADGRATLGVSVDVFVRKVTVKVERAKCRSVRDVYVHRNDLVLATLPALVWVCRVPARNDTLARNRVYMRYWLISGTRKAGKAILSKTSQKRIG